MNSYLFFLGHNSTLSVAELNSRFPDVNFNLISPHLVVGEFDTDPTSTSQQLGSITKLATLVDTSSVSDLPSIVSSYLTKYSSHHFSIYLPQGKPQDAHSLSHEIKTTLASEKFSVRFFLPKSDSLAPVLIAKQKVSEFTYLASTKQLFVTTWVHDFESWIARDRSRPYITPKLGMLPPKLARTLINLSLLGRDPLKTTLLDPFCGSGTVLMEARLLGLSTIGSDLSSAQVEGAQSNVQWLPKDHYFSDAPTTIFHTSDATHLSSLISSPIDVIVTEPYLGPLHPKEQDYANISKGLYKLYLGAIKDWQKFLSPKNCIVLAYPVYSHPTSLKYLSRFVDYCENLGYNLRVKNLVFTRSGAKIERHIIILDK